MPSQASPQGPRRPRFSLIHLVNEHDQSTLGSVVAGLDPAHLRPANPSRDHASIVLADDPLRASPSRATRGRNIVPVSLGADRFHIDSDRSRLAKPVPNQSFQTARTVTRAKPAAVCSAAALVGEPGSKPITPGCQQPAFDFLRFSDPPPQNRGKRRIGRLWITARPTFRRAASDFWPDSQPMTSAEPAVPATSLTDSARRCTLTPTVARSSRAGPTGIGRRRRCTATGP